MSYMPAYKR